MARPEPTMPSVGRRARRGAALALLAAALQLAFLAAPVPADGPYLVHDLGAEMDLSWNPLSGMPSPPVVMGDALYFFHDDGIHGQELWRSDGTALGTRMVRDLCPGACGSYLIPPARALAALGSTLFFAGHDGVHGVELWATDGTAGGTRLVADLRPGLDSSTPRNFVVASGLLFFVADDGVHGAGLWRSDGTAAGTWLVRYFAPSPEPGGIKMLAAMAGRLYLYVEATAERTGLWVSDGTAAGTQRIAAFDPTGAGWDPYDRFAVLPGGILLFREKVPGSSTNLWRSDGTPEGTYFLRSLGTWSSTIQIAGDAGYVVGPRAGGDGWELVRSDGTPEGTETVPLPAGASPSLQLGASLGGRLLLTVHQAETGYEPWVVDGLTASLLVDLDPTPGNSSIGWYSFAAVVGDEIVFLADDGSGAGSELWATDLTPAGTRRISDLDLNASFFPSPELPPSFRLEPPEALDGRLLFPTWNAEKGVRLWRADPAAGTTSVVRQIGWQSSSLRPPRDFYVFSAQYPFLCLEVTGDRLLFEARTSVMMGNTAWLVSSDGSIGGLETIFPVEPAGVSCAANGTRALIYSRASDNSERGFTLTDGLPEGTEPPFYPDPSSVWPRSSPEMVPFGAGWLFGTKMGLWESDGTEAGTQLRVPAAPAGDYWWPIASSSLGAVYGKGDGSLHFLAPGASPVELLAADSGRRIEWIGPAATGFAVVVYEEAYGVELWWTDGTPAGTRRVRDIAPGPASGIWIPTPFENTFEPRLEGKVAALGDRVLFAADDGIHGEELWVSDGTEAGTFLLGDLMPGPLPSSPRELTPAEDRLFFVAEHPALGRELWVTDGTPAGTVPAADLVPGGGSSCPGDLVWLDGRLVFSAWTPEWGREAWRTDGTPAGTWRLTDIAPGPASSSPGLFRQVGSTLLFAANDEERGFELWGLTVDGSVPLFRDGWESGGPHRWDAATP